MLLPAASINWGYAPVGFFAPHRGFSSRSDPLGPLDEFRDMVKELHRAGIEVILDVVYNHTAEGGPSGPTHCFRGLDNLTYNIIDRDRSRHADFSGTGNNLNANHPVVRRMIVDSLRYWVEEMHIDGFQFDLASILARDSFGNVMSNPPVLWDIESHPSLAGTKMIAEAWDAAGLYQAGTFVGDSSREYWEPLDFQLPPVAAGAGAWGRWIDTALDPSHEIVPWSTAMPVSAGSYRAGACSVVVLVASLDAESGAARGVLPALSRNLPGSPGT